MQNQIRKKKKQQTHKVTLLADKLQNNSYAIPDIQNAYFPYQPYTQQKKLISKIYQSIQKRENALIQSPTGTGKTLCMLVASLASLCTLTKNQTPANTNPHPNPNNSNTNQNVNKVPKIYYLTRTHSQITQVVNQLKRISWYQCKINIIASRQHLCINRNLKQLKGRLLDRGCQQICKQKLCKYKQQTSQNVYPLKQWLTLQQLCQKGTKKQFCPFYYSKQSTQKCQLTIMPFNYLLDWNLFQHNNLNIKNSIIIFDQAHNIDSLAQQGSSLQIDTEMVTQCLSQLKNLQQSSKCRYLHKKFDSQHDSSDICHISTIKNLITRIYSMLKQSCQQKNYNNLQDMLKIIKKLTNFVNKQQQFPGIDLNNYQDILYILDKVKKIFINKKIDSQHYDIFCSTLNRILKILDTNYNNMSDYYMYVGPKSIKNYTCKLICLNASFTFQRITQQKPRSIILCSGTLGNFQIWQKQLCIPFHTKLKIPSFIKSNQICVNIINSNINNTIRYQFSYHNKNKQSQYQSLIQQLKQIQQIVPNGIIVSFSTYQLMQKCMKYCIHFKKPIFYQSKNQNIDKIYTRYVQAARTQIGAFLFIVLKGKFAQGINFNNQLCRCLIVIGIPFLPINDYKIIRKKQYIENKFGKQQAQQWYYTQTFKAVNQVIGRAIRSKQDYGCILLFDLRYARKDIKKQLPTWFANNLPQDNNNNKIKYITRINNFFKRKPWLQVKPQLIQNPSQLQLALSKSILNSSSSDIALQTLLNHQTPIKPTKPQHKKLQIITDEENLQQIQTKDYKKKIKKNNKTQKYKQKSIQKQKQRQEQQTKKYNKIQSYPWLSINYFIEDQIKDYVIRSKQRVKFNKNDNKINKFQSNFNDGIHDDRWNSQNQQIKATLSFELNNKKIKKYM